MRNDEYLEICMEYVFYELPWSELLSLARCQRCMTREEIYLFSYYNRFQYDKEMKRLATLLIHFKKCPECQNKVQQLLVKEQLEYLEDRCEDHVPIVEEEMGS